MERTQPEEYHDVSYTVTLSIRDEDNDPNPAEIAQAIYKGVRDISTPDAVYVGSEQEPEEEAARDDARTEAFRREGYTVMRLGGDEPLGPLCPVCGSEDYGTNGCGNCGAPDPEFDNDAHYPERFTDDGRVRCSVCGGLDQDADHTHPRFRGR